MAGNSTVILGPQAYYETPGHVIAAATAIPAIDILAVILRVWARRRQKQAFKADDWLMVPATVVTVAIGVNVVYGVSQHALAYRLEIPADFDGDPLSLVTDQLVTTSKVGFAFALMLPVALGFIKSSVILFYMRFFSAITTSTTHKLLVGLNIFVIAWTVAFFFASLFQCRLDIWATWGSADQLEAHCPGTMYLDVALCATDLATDVVIVCIPIWPIWRLNLSTAKRLTVSVVFLLGAVTIVASSIRLMMEVKIATVGFDPNDDEIRKKQRLTCFYAVAFTTYLYWGMVECGIGLFAACLPIIQVHVRKLSIFKRVYSLVSKTSKPEDTPGSERIRNSMRPEQEGEAFTAKAETGVSYYSSTPVSDAKSNAELGRSLTVEIDTMEHPRV
ncbi:plasma membrane protein Pth11-like protein [Podospora appendiculata]|uniref:Plasma membrane protein Pth11-like protein n=1 Tax=Podospora appendiculata TaxID=314037 RepID=A0AAE0XJ10_9PEZI|nr:plasma membrane protein Pth11-like protein [Podospora appendiculata]